MLYVMWRTYIPISKVMKISWFGVLFLVSELLKKAYEQGPVIFRTDERSGAFPEGKHDRKMGE